MKLSICLILLLAATAFAGIGDPYPADWFGLVTTLDDPDWDWPCTDTVSPMQQVTLHLVIANPSAGAVSSWHCGMVEVVGGVASQISLAAGSDLTPDDAWDVMIGVGPLALTPNASGFVHVADLTVTVLGPGSEAAIDILPHTTPLGDPAYHYVGPDGATVVPLIKENESGSDYWLNVTCSVDVPNEPASWSAIKALFD